MSFPVESTRPASTADARIDWGHGRLIGFSVPQGDDHLFDVVQLHLSGVCVTSAVANRSVFELARELAGLNLPAREQSAFELRIPQVCLLPSHLSGAAVELELRTAQGQSIFKYTVSGPHELLRLTEGVPADLIFQVQFRDLRDGAVHGVVIDRHGAGSRPQLMARVNQHKPEPLPIYEVTADGRQHLFSVPLRASQLESGFNEVQVLTPDGQPMASYPIQAGGGLMGEVDRRVHLLEAELAFLKHLVLTQSNEAMPARLALMKGEIINICSDMLALQRTNLEREMQGQAAAARKAPGPV